MSGCVQGLKSYFTGKNSSGEAVDSHLTNFFRNWKARDSALKFAAAVSDVANYALAQSNASDDIKKGVQSTTTAFKEARVVFGLFNVLEGTVPYIFQRSYSIGKLFWEIVSPKKDLRPATDKKTLSEKILSLVSQVMDLIGCTAFAIAFGICRPIIFAVKHFKAHISATAQKVAQQFVLVMLINHISSFVKGVVDMVNGALAFIREKLAEENSEVLLDPTEKSALSKFIDKVVKNTLLLLEKAAEIIVSTIGVFKLKAPALVSLCLTLFAATLGLYKVWQDTAVN